MIKLFFITGLPRSRTAWFSAFMTASGYPCIHDGMNGCKGIKEYSEKIKNVSDSNTGLVFISNPYPDRPMLIIHRKGRLDGVDGMNDAINALHNIDGLHVDFDCLNEKMPDIFKHLTGQEIDDNIFAIFKELNITDMTEIDNDSAREFINETRK